MVRRFELLSLASGEKVPTAIAATFQFTKGSTSLADRMSKAQAGSTNGGADLIVRDMSSGAMRNIGNVNLYEFDNSKSEGFRSRR